MALPDGRLVWARTDLAIAPLDRVILGHGGEELEGTVVVAPDQLLGAPPVGDAQVIRVLPRQDGEYSTDALPGAEMPPLGARVQIGGVTGRITALDPVAGMARVSPDHGGSPIQTTVADIRPLDAEQAIMAPEDQPT